MMYLFHKNIQSRTLGRCHKRIDGLYSDSGTAWEIGYAYALGKNIQMSINNGVKDMSIMPFASAWAIENYKNIKLV